MPHRKALGAKAADQRAENELGRMVLRGELEEMLGTAGDLYRGEWKAYIASLAAPRALAVGGGRARYCVGCLVLRGGDFCLCELRKRRWNATRAALGDSGATRVVDFVCLQEWPIGRAHLWLLRLGLEVLGRHYGLTRRADGVLGNVAPQIVKPPPP